MTKPRVVRLWIGILTAALVASVALTSVRAASPCEWDGIERIVAVGDVHGAYDRYVEILRTAGLVDAGGHWSGGATHFVQLGDVVDRGSDSRKALDFLRRLEREAQAAGGAGPIPPGNPPTARQARGP